MAPPRLPLPLLPLPRPRPLPRLLLVRRRRLLGVTAHLVATVTAIRTLIQIEETERQPIY